MLNRSGANSRSRCCEAEVLRARDPMKGSATPLEIILPVISLHENIPSLIADKLGDINAFLRGGFDTVAELIEGGDIEDPEFFFSGGRSTSQGQILYGLGA